MWRICPECGEEFYADEHWKKICVSCWKKQKGYGRPTRSVSRKSDAQALRRENMFLKEIVADLRFDLETIRREKAELPEGFMDNLRKIISLTHPDKHNNSQTATQVTTYLLELRTELMEGKF